jgi:hypothetical protein
MTPTASSTNASGHRFGSHWQQTTIGGLTMDWYISPDRRGSYVIHGFIDRVERMTCQLMTRWTRRQALKLVENHLRWVAEYDATKKDQRS